MCQVFVPKRNVICYVASQSHMTWMLVKFINDHSYKVLLINRTRYRVLQVSLESRASGLRKTSWYTSSHTSASANCLCRLHGRSFQRTWLITNNTSGLTMIAIDCLLDQLLVPRSTSKASLVPRPFGPPSKGLGTRLVEGLRSRQ